MEDGNLAVLVDAKTEYTKQLVNILKQNIYFMVQKLFQESQTQSAEEETPTKVLFLFQRKLSEIPKWNNEIIKTECEKIITNSKCDWIDELITAVFVSHTRILTSINFSKSKGKIDLKIPKTQNFIHRCFIDIARYFWKNSYLFDDRVNKYEFQKNRREAESMIEMSINETIRTELPVKNILKKYLGTDFNDTEEDEEDFTDEPMSGKQKRNLKKMVMKELENCSNEKLNQMKLILSEPVAAEPVAELVSTAVAAEPVAELVSTTVAAEPVAELVSTAVAAEPVAELGSTAVAAEPVVELVSTTVAAEPMFDPALKFDTFPISIEMSDEILNDETAVSEKNKIVVKKINDPFELNIQEINLDNDLSSIVTNKTFLEHKPEPEPEPVIQNDAQIKKDILSKYSKNKNYQFFN